VYPERVQDYAPKVLTQKQRHFYFENGYLLLDSIVPMETIERLRAVTNSMVDRSRSITISDAIFDLEPGHTADTPRLRRLSSPVAHDPLYWKFASDSLIADIAADLVGPNVKFHHSKLNFKWSEGGEEVRWHQDIQSWAHTNYSPLTIGTYLYDVGPEQGPLGVVPRSHKGSLFSQYNDKDQWTGDITDRDLETVDLDTADYLMGPAGSVTIHNCCTIHGSKPNQSDIGRPLLLNVYSAADAFTYMPNPLTTEFAGSIVRGKAVREAFIDPRPCVMSPDWSKGYTSLFALQQKEDWSEDQMDRVHQHYSGGAADQSRAT
jgi:ectoine hydroxylase